MDGPNRLPVHIPLFGAIEEIPRFVMFFLAGVTFYLYREMIPQSGNCLWLLAWRCIANVAAATHRFELSLAIFGTYLIFYCGFNTTVRVRHFARYGDFSYGMYLYGFVVQQLLVRICSACRAIR